MAWDENDRERSTGTFRQRADRPRERGGPVTDGEDGRTPVVSRREFAIGAVGATVGLVGASIVVAQPQPTWVEAENWQVAEVRVEEQFNFVGASAILYNEAEQSRTASVRFQLYREGDGRREYEGTDEVRVPGGEERHVARWWKKDRPGTTSPQIAYADVEIV